jgi:membrane-bound lytic murein transglycosylase F
MMNGNKMKKTGWIVLAGLGAAVLVVSLVLLLRTGESSLDQIREQGEITVLTRNNGHCYYNYQDKPMGFEYDLAKAFAGHLGVELKVRTTGWQDLFDDLGSGKGDFVAASLTVTPARQRLADFSDGYLTVQQRVIVHQSNYNLDEMEDLNGKTVYVRRGTSYEERLRELKDRGMDIKVRLHDEVPTEEFIRMVAEKEILVTVADSNIALLNRRYYPEVKVGFPLEEPQVLGWAVRKGNTGLKEAIDAFFETIIEDGTYAKIHDKYYGNVEIYDYVDLRKYHQRIKTRLPKYRGPIQKESSKHGFDWRLIAAMVYQESHFDPDAISHTGVRGIMQLTEVTAEEMGVEDRREPSEAIRGGVRYLKKLHKRFDGAQEPDRTLIALASYNVGYGHVRDAQKLAAEMGMNPGSWSALQQVLPLLRYPKYYRRTEHGYCRGTEPVRYVKRIRTYYDILKREAISSS